MTSVLFAAGTFLHYVFGILMFAVALFLILLVLVQRGRGGGLTGALGGMGGQSAFGTKAGDMFTRVTMVTAGVWILLCMASIWLLGSHDEWGDSGKPRSGGTTQGTTTAPGPVNPVAPSSPSPGTGAADASPASTDAAAAPAAESQSAPAAAPVPVEAPEAPPSPAAPKAKE